MKRRRSKAQRWAGAKSPAQAFRDREWYNYLTVSASA